MDIIVWVPADQMRHFYLDKCDGSATAYWRLAKQPLRLEVGDFIWFGDKTGVFAGAPVTESSHHESEKMVGDPSGWRIYWKGVSVVHLEPVISNIRPAKRNFRYLEPSEQKYLRARYERGF